MKKKKQNKNDELIPIKNKKQLQAVSELFELNSFYITLNSQLVSFQDNIFFGEMEAQQNYEKLVKSFQRVYKESSRFQEKVEAFTALNSIQIMPVRYH